MIIMPTVCIFEMLGRKSVKKHNMYGFAAYDSLDKEQQGEGQAANKTDEKREKGD